MRCASRSMDAKFSTSDCLGPLARSSESVSLCGSSDSETWPGKSPSDSIIDGELTSSSASGTGLLSARYGSVPMFNSVLDLTLNGPGMHQLTLNFVLPSPGYFEGSYMGIVLPGPSSHVVSLICSC